MENIQQIITYIAAVVAAAVAGWQAVRAKIHANSLKKVGGKVDVVSIIYEAIIAVEKAMNGAPDGASKFLHSQEKKKAAMELIQQKCVQLNIPFDYGYVSGKIEEVFNVLIKEFEKKLLDK